MKGSNLAFAAAETGETGSNGGKNPAIDRGYKYIYVS